MKIGIDLDGTITDFNSYIISYGKSKYTIKDLNAYNIEDIFNINEIELYEFKELIRNKLRMEVPPRKDAQLYINKIHDLGYQIYIITSRKEKDQVNCLHNTKKWLDDNGIYYDELIIGNSNKLEECIKNSIDIFVDDKIKHCTKCRDYNIKTYLFDNNYNKDADLERVCSFEELYNKIKD